jgi:hypothetical protein
MYLEWTCPIHIIIEQMHVTYDDVSTRIPDHWLKYNPTVRSRKRKPLIECSSV